MRPSLVGLTACLCLLAQATWGQGLSVAVSDATFQPETDGGVGLLSFTATLSAGPDGIPSGTQATVIWSTGDQTATGGASCGAGVDYRSQQQVALSLSASNPSGVIGVSICGDSLDEANETFTVSLSPGSGNLTIQDDTAVGTIVDDDNPPQIRVADARVDEGNAGITQVPFTVTLSTASGQPVQATFTTSTTGMTATQGAACGGTTDLRTTSDVVRIPVGATSATISVPVCADTVPEADQTFRVQLSNAQNATIPSNAAGTGTIANDDARLSVSDVSVTEPATGTRSVSFSISLAAVSPHSVSVDYRTVDGTAKAVGAGKIGPWTCPMIDYFSRSGRLTIAAGQTAGTVTTSVCGGDSSSEPSETFFLDLSNPTGTTIADGRGTATIREGGLRIRLP